MLLLLMLVSSLALAACSSTSGDAAKPTDSEANAEQEQAEPEKVEPEAEESESVDEFEIDMAKVKILDVRKGTANDFEGQEPVILVTYEVTNKSEEPLSPSTVWIACVEATQETDEVVERLETPITDFVEPELQDYYEENSAGMSKEVKTGGTLKDVWSYKIIYPEQPVKLTFTKGMSGEKLGEKVINLDELN